VEKASVFSHLNHFCVRVNVTN